MIIDKHTQTACSPFEFLIGETVELHNLSWLLWTYAYLPLLNLMMLWSLL